MAVRGRRYRSLLVGHDRGRSVYATTSQPSTATWLRGDRAPAELVGHRAGRCVYAVSNPCTGPGVVEGAQLVGHRAGRPVYAVADNCALGSYGSGPALALSYSPKVCGCDSGTVKIPTKFTMFFAYWRSTGSGYVVAPLGSVVMTLDPLRSDNLSALWVGGPSDIATLRLVDGTLSGGWCNIYLSLGPLQAIDDSGTLVNYSLFYICPIGFKGPLGDCDFTHPNLYYGLTSGLNQGIPFSQMESGVGLYDALYACVGGVGPDSISGCLPGGP